MMRAEMKEEVQELENRSRRTISSNKNRKKAATVDERQY